MYCTAGESRVVHSQAQKHDDTAVLTNDQPMAAFKRG